MTFRHYIQPRSRHKEIEAHPKAAVLLKQANRLADGTYDLQSLNDAFDADLQALRGVFDMVHPIKPRDDKKLLQLRAVLVALQHPLGKPGIDRGRVLYLLTALSSPLLSAPVKEARLALLRMQRGGDVEAFLAVCESVAERYAPKPPSTPSDSAQDGSTSSKKIDLRLICFEFLA